MHRSAVTVRVLLLAVCGWARPSVMLNNGVIMPLLALDTAQARNSTAAVLAALGAPGLRHVQVALDRSDLPGVAAGLRLSGLSRWDYFMSGVAPACTSVEGCYQQTTEGLTSGLRRLGLDRWDLFLLQAPPTGCGPAGCALVRAQWRALQDSYLSGRAWAIGVSQYCPACIDCLLTDHGTTFWPAVNRVRWHVGMGPDPAEVVGYSRAKGITLQAFLPLDRGAVDTDADCLAVGRQLNRSAAAIGVCWLLQQAVNKTAVAFAPGQQLTLAEYVEAAEIKLSGAQMARLDAKRTPGSGGPSCTGG